MQVPINSNNDEASDSKSIGEKADERLKLSFDSNQFLPGI